MNLYRALALLIVFNIHNLAHSQSQIDSFSFYKKRISSVNKEYRDSMRNDPRYLQALEYLSKNRRGRWSDDNYIFSFALYTQLSSANFTKFNSDYVPLGFSSLSGIASGIGLGFGSKKKRRIFDLNLLTIPINKTSKRGSEKIKTGLSTIFQFEWAYDLVNSNRINLYPYAGLGFRSTTFSYEVAKQTSPNPANVTAIVINDASVSDERSRLGYQAGLGFDLLVTKRRGGTGILFFIKGGTNRPFKEKAFRFAGFHYDPGFRFGQWTAAIGIKLIAKE